MASMFLTEEQRAALDAALQAKEAEQQKAKAAQHHAKNHALNSNRSKAAGGKLGGGPKKGGGGGKYTWGNILEVGDANAVLDSHDPNYDSEEALVDEDAGRARSSHSRRAKPKPDAAAELQAAAPDGHHAAASNGHQSEAAVSNAAAAAEPAPTAAAPGSAASPRVTFSPRDTPAAGAEARHAAEVRAYKQAMTSIVEEYFASGDIDDVEDSLQASGSAVGGPAQHLAHYFVKRLLTLAMDRKDREREMASLLLSALYAEVLASDQIVKGCWSVVEGLEDLVLDVPEAPTLMAKFLARAVVDDVLPPAVITRIPDAPPAVAELRSRVSLTLSERHRHSAESVLRCWGAAGAGAGVSYDRSKEAIHSLLAEYCASADMEEARRCLHALAIPFFHHEFVKQALVMCLDHPERMDLLVALLRSLSEMGELPPSQLAKGVQRVRDNLSDMALDNPQARDRYQEAMAKVNQAHLCEESLPAAPASTSSRSDPAAPPLGVTMYKQQCGAALREYFASRDAGEVARRLAELDEPGLSHLFVKSALSLAMDRRDSEREAVANLLATLPKEVLPADQVHTGFMRFLHALDDLVLDCPHALHLGSLFLGRAIVDEVLPPVFLVQVVSHLDADSLGLSAVRAAANLLCARHESEYLTNCWLGGSGAGLEAVRQQMGMALREYCSCGDVGEVARCLSDLAVPQFHHEVVLLAAELAAERFHPPDVDVVAAAQPLAALLVSLHTRGSITTTQMEKGLARVAAALGEEVLDYGPAAREVFAWLQARMAAHLTVPDAP